jgi:hypothetical protein
MHNSSLLSRWQAVIYPVETECCHSHFQTLRNPGHVLQHLRDVFSHLAQLTTAIRHADSLGSCRRLVPAPLPRPIFGQSLPYRFRRKGIIVIMSAGVCWIFSSPSHWLPGLLTVTPAIRSGAPASPSAAKPLLCIEANSSYLWDTELRRVTPAHGMAVWNL